MHPLYCRIKLLYKLFMALRAIVPRTIYYIIFYQKTIGCTTWTFLIQIKKPETNVGRCQAFYNSLVIKWRSILLVEKTIARVPGEY